MITDGRPHRFRGVHEPAYPVKLQHVMKTTPAVLQRRKELQASQQQQHADRQASIRRASARAAEAEEQLRKSELIPLHAMLAYNNPTAGLMVANQQGVATAGP